MYLPRQGGPGEVLEGIFTWGEIGVDGCKVMLVWKIIFLHIDQTIGEITLVERQVKKKTESSLGFKCEGTQDS